jgi:DNA (cytosine-5)-methyltransferase 1
MSVGSPIVTTMSFTFIDLFAGIGGTRIALESVGGTCVFTSEWDKYARQTYEVNFKPDHKVYGDVREIDEKLVPRHDVLVAGFPCQPFSLAGVSKKNSLGKKHGFSCPIQGNLFFDIARIAAEKNPKVLLLENVKNLLSHDKGRTFKIILKTLEEDLGYKVDYRVIDARYFVPQHRERIFIVATKPNINIDLNDLRIPTKNPTLQEILHGYEKQKKKDPRFQNMKTGKALPKYTLSDNLWVYLQEYAEKHRLRGNGFGFGLFGPEDTSRTLSARYHKDGAEILIKQNRKNPRRLTPREAARLMGFPDTFEIPVSDTQAYRQFGNSVVVPVVKAVAKLIAEELSSGTKEISKGIKKAS